MNVSSKGTIRGSMVRFGDYKVTVENKDVLGPVVSGHNRPMMAPAHVVVAEANRLLGIPDLGSGQGGKPRVTYNSATGQFDVPGNGDDFVITAAPDQCVDDFAKKILKR